MHTHTHTHTHRVRETDRDRQINCDGSPVLYEHQSIFYDSFNNNLCFVQFSQSWSLNNDTLSKGHAVKWYLFSMCRLLPRPVPWHITSLTNKPNTSIVIVNAQHLSWFLLIPNVHCIHCQKTSSLQWDRKRRETEKKGTSKRDSVIRPVWKEPCILWLSTDQTVSSN